MMRISLVLALVFAGASARAAPSIEDARVLSGIVAEAAATVPKTDVLTAEDVRAALDVEAARQLSGCDAAGCLAEIASALDAQIMITGTLGMLGDDVVLQLVVIDGKAARSVARRTVTAPSVAELVAPSRAFITSALTPLSHTDERRLRVVVVDFQLASSAALAADGSAGEGEDGFSPLALSGGAALGISIVALAVGATFDAIAMMEYAEAHAASTSAADARSAYAASDASAVVAGAGYVSGGVLLLAGIGLLTAGLLIP